MIYSKIIDACSYLLDNFPEAQSCKFYLDSRLSKQSQKLFQFGYFPDMKNIQALTSIIGEDQLTESKLFYSKEISDSMNYRIINFSFFENYPLIMPFKDPYGNSIAIVGRSLLSDEERKSAKIAKYKNTIFTKGNYLFGLYENSKYILEKDCVYIVEGQFDVIKSVEKGFKNIVALGNSNMTAYQFSVINRYANNIYLLLDNDEAGEKGRKKILEKFSKFANIKNAYLPDGFKDIDEYFSQNNELLFD